MAECDVLIVGEDGQVRQVLHQIFLVSGYKCLLASDGHEGLEVFRRSHPALIVTARASHALTAPHPPHLSGIDLLSQARQEDPDVAVIVVGGSINVGELLIAAERALEAHHRAPPEPAPAPALTHRSDDAGMRWGTPEQFLEAFEYRSRKYPLDPQFSVGIPIIRAWMNLRSRQTVSQADLDGLLRQFAPDAEGTWIYDLWSHVVRWGAELELSVPSRHPWGRA